MKRSTFRRPELPPRAKPVLVPLSRPVRMMQPVSGACVSIPKRQTFRSERWLRAAASLPCVLCGREGTQAAHRNLGKGFGVKTDDCLVAALCPACHSAIDQGKDMSRDERRAVLDDAILRTLAEMARQGLVGVVR